jgi:hypothetical protein
LAGARRATDCQATVSPASDHAECAAESALRAVARATKGVRNMRLFAAVDHAIARFEAFVLAFGVILMAANSIANVIGRFVFGQSIYFTEELNQFLIVLVTFVGLP